MATSLKRCLIDQQSNFSNNLPNYLRTFTSNFSVRPNRMFFVENFHISLDHLGFGKSVIRIGTVGSQNFYMQHDRNIWFHFFIIPNCVFSYVSPSGQPELMHSRTGCICLAFLQCVFSNVPSKRLHKMMQNHIGCICLTFLHCVFSNVSSNRLNERMHNHTGCICLIFLHCVI